MGWDGMGWDGDGDDQKRSAWVGRLEILLAERCSALIMAIDLIMVQE
jgi:hypothetical protein